MVPNIAIILTDAEQQILWVNNDFTNITGYSLREVEGRKPGSILQGKDSEPQAIERIRANLEKGLPCKDQILNYRKNGETYHCKLAIHPIFNAQRQLCNYIAFEVDGSKTNEEDFDVPLQELEKKYHSSSLRGGKEIKLFLKLKDFFETDKPYLDPNLDLRATADQLHTNTKYLSQIVNHLSNHNFQFFINTFRVEEAKQKLLSDDYQHLTLYGIALQCGFKNKSTFYKVFKEVSGITPRQFIMLYKNCNN